MTTILTISLFCAVVGYVFTQVFMDEKMILWPYYKLICRLPLWLSKPLGTCMDCFTGQLGLWVYLYLFTSKTLSGTNAYHYDLFNHIFVVCLSITIAKIINKWAN
jgi:hypothetical protein